MKTVLIEFEPTDEPLQTAPADDYPDGAIWRAIYAFNLVCPLPRGQDATLHLRAMKAAIASAARQLEPDQVPIVIPNDEREALQALLLSLPSPRDSAGATALRNVLTRAYGEA